MDVNIGNAGEVKRYLDSIFEPPKPSNLDYAAFFGVDTSVAGWEGTLINVLLGSDKECQRSKEFMQLDDTGMLRLGYVMLGLMDSLVG